MKESSEFSERVLCLYTVALSMFSVEEQVNYYPVEEQANYYPVEEQVNYYPVEEQVNYCFELKCRSWLIENRFPRHPK